MGTADARYPADCRRLLADIDEAAVAATGTHAVPRGTLTITAPVLFVMGRRVRRGGRS